MAHGPQGGRPSGTLDAAEVARFEALAEDWWNPGGRFRPLHKLNPVRLAFVRDRACAHWGRDPKAPRPLSGLSLLDIGCGGGLIAEPLARLGATVTGIDPSAANVKVAADHGAAGGLAITYRQALPEDLARAGESFDAVLALEVIEHVADAGAFLDACASLMKPGGILVIATLNRTLKSFALAIVGAEYVLGWLPRGTHDWSRFIRPSELAAALSERGLRLAEIAGVTYNPLADRWSSSSDVSVNYMALATDGAPGRS